MRVRDEGDIEGGAGGEYYLPLPFPPPPPPPLREIGAENGGN